MEYTEITVATQTHLAQKAIAVTYGFKKNSLINRGVGRLMFKRGLLVYSFGQAIIYRNVISRFETHATLKYPLGNFK